VIKTFLDKLGQRCTIFEFCVNGEGNLDQDEVANIASTNEPIVQNIVEMTKWGLQEHAHNNCFIGIALGIPVEKIKRQDAETQKKDLKTYYWILCGMYDYLNAQFEGCRKDDYGLHLIS